MKHLQIVLHRFQVIQMFHTYIYIYESGLRIPGPPQWYGPPSSRSREHGTRDHTYIHTCMHACIHASIHPSIHTYRHTQTDRHTYIPIYLPTYVPTYLRTYVPTYTTYNLRTHAQPTYTTLHTYIPTYLPTYIHTYQHTNIPPPQATGGGTRRTYHHHRPQGGDHGGGGGGLGVLGHIYIYVYQIISILYLYTCISIHMYIDTRVYRYTCISTYLQNIYNIYIYIYTNIHVYHICLLSSRTLLSGQHRPAAAPILKPCAFPTLRKWHRARTRRNHGSTQRIKNSLSHVVVLHGTLGGFLKRGVLQNRTDE